VSVSVSVSVSSTDLELIKESSEQTVGIRFADVPIAKGSSVASAYIQFSVDEMNDENPCSLTIRAEAADDAGTFTGTDHNISSRPTTGASVVWNPAAWHIAGAKGPSQRTSNIADVIEEVIGRTGWSSGNALVIIISGTGRRTAESYDGANGAAAMLHVELAD